MSEFAIPEYIDREGEAFLLIPTDVLVWVRGGRDRCVRNTDALLVYKQPLVRYIVIDCYYGVMVQHSRTREDYPYVSKYGRTVYMTKEYVSVYYGIPSKIIRQFYDKYMCKGVRCLHGGKT